MNAVVKSTPEAASRPLRVLHVGCGTAPLPEFFDGLGDVIETRLDANPDVKPDIVASMTDLGDIGPFDRIYSSHCLEHLNPDDVMKALGEFLRVLRPGGQALVFVPDLEDIKPTFETVYEAPCGPVTGHDMYYGHLGMSRGNPYMRHLTGFVSDTLRGAMTQAGFRGVEVRRVPVHQLLGAGAK